MVEAHAARQAVGDTDGTLRPRGVPATWSIVWLVVCGAALAAGWWLLVPHTPTGGLELAAVDPTGGLAAPDLDRIRRYGTWARPFEAASIVLPVVVVLLLGLTPAGARMTGRLGVGIRLPSLRALLIAFVVVGIAWVVSLPAVAGAQVVYDTAGSLSSDWGSWAGRQLVRLVQWWAVAALAVLAVRVSARLLRRSWWYVLTLVALVLVLGGSLASGSLVVTSSGYPSLREGQLRTDVMALADDLGVGVRDVQVVPRTPSTTTYNAYVTGVGDDHVVVLYETLLARSSRDDVRVVAAHELGHVAEHDSERRAVLAGLGAAVMTALVGAAATWRPVRRRARTQELRISDAPAVPMLIALTVAAGVLVIPVIDAASRAFEVRADLTALEATDDPAALAAVVSRSAGLYLTDPDPAWPWRILSGHPSPGERMRLAEAWAARSD